MSESLFRVIARLSAEIRGRPRPLASLLLPMGDREKRTAHDRPWTSENQAIRVIQCCHRRQQLAYSFFELEMRKPLLINQQTDLIGS